MANPSVPTIDWQACHPESGLPFLCGTAEVPLDYKAPEGEKLSLALIKLSATTSTGKIGSLFYNPGGPGNSGVDFVLGIGQYLPTEIRAKFDVIGFDPRGTFRSSPLVCFNGPVDVPPFFFPQTPDEEALWAEFNTTMANACKTNGGSVLDHMSTANVARDLDLLRQAVGDSQLNFVGFSHGSFLGTTYANLFPNNIRAMVLDGIVDPIAYTTGAGNEGYNLPVTTRLGINEGMQATLNEFLRLCDQAGLAQCSFSNAAASKFQFLVDYLRTAPVHMVDPTNGPFDLTYDQFIATVASALASSSEWPKLADALNEIYGTITSGSADTALKAGIAFSALINAIGSAPGPDELTHVAQQLAVMCSDSINPDNHAAWSSVGETADANGEIFGRLTAWQSSPCAVWQGKDPDRYDSFAPMTTAPILLVANRFDPLTPYEGAQQTHSLLPNSAMLTLEGWGHTSLFLSSCVNQAVSSYLLTSQIPNPGTSCQQDAAPFANTSSSGPTTLANLMKLISSFANPSGGSTPFDLLALLELISSQTTPPDDTTPPDTTPPDTTLPDTTPPGTTSPGTTSPGTKSPGTKSPGTTPPKNDSVNTKPEKINTSGTEAPPVAKTFTIFDPATSTVIIPAVQVGNKVEFVNVKLGFNPDGTLTVLSSEVPDLKAPVAASAVYDPATGMVTIPDVLVNGQTEFVNVKLKANPDGTFSVLSNEKPAVVETFTIYDPATGTATIPAVQVNDKVEFANVKLGFNPEGTLSVLSSEAPKPEVPVAANTVYDPATGTATISEVLVNGKPEFINVKLKANPDGTFSVLSSEKPPVS
ncbi:alpha/beta hydrolase [Methylobacter sp. YRD-M1]|uniref:alpha/beta hydrolase n=1 Tax=Methylobacter sp. YRD-M1 TaxID=2911520 RepID=UPI00227C8831|nr:alpha/beta hydrolase [Methylobacter sp. YRD-M1]WAK03785.1 alpha/beta hydrolase [Methylobacter sp. YRD-M1]